MREQLDVHVRPDAAAASRIFGGSMEPEMLGRTPGNLASPLGSDVMRAFDAHQTANAESAAGWSMICVTVAADLA